jgi:NADPH-dependent 2,4-dienoyl-CoA reductase/sulfur reductase-like enzyme
MHAVVLGNGVTGFTAALRLRELRPDWRITMVSGESTHPWSRPALMYVFMGHMRYADTKPFEDSMWPRKQIELVRAWATRIDLARRRVDLHGREPLAYDRLLLALGSKPNRFGWPGQDLAGVQGLYGLPDLHALHENVRHARRAVVVGGGLIGIELAEMLHSRGIDVTLLVREASYWDIALPDEESAMVNRVIRAAGLDLRLSTELSAIEDDGRGRVGAVRTASGERIECQLVGLTAGVSPNLDLLEGSGIATGRGVRVDRALRTSAPDVWAAGDCAEIVDAGDERGLVQQVWYTGKQQGRAAAESMAGRDVRYEPAPWFNSAKFLDLEYQVYGDGPRGVPGASSVHWEHAHGLRSLRIVYLPDEERRVIGFHVLGARERQRVCERWIAERAPLERVLDELPAAGFDPEFTPRFEPQALHHLRSAAR